MGKRETNTAVLERPAPVESKPQPAPCPMAPITPPSVDSLADQLGREEITYAKAAETIFDRPQETWTPGDWAVLRRVGPHPGGTAAHDRNAFNGWLTQEAGRLSVVRRQQQAAGSPGDREAARQRADEATAKLGIEEPRIRAKITELENELATLTQTAKQAQADVDRREQAVVSLREDRFLPSYVLDEINQANRRQKSEFRGELAQLRGRLRGIEAVLAIDPESRDGVNSIRLHVEANRDIGGDTVSRLQRFFETRESDQQQATREVSVRKVNTSEWASYCRTLQTEAAEIRQRIAELEPREQEAAAELEKLRSHYVPE